ncbi:MAG: NAD(P)-dependent oxidoreductase, partial [Betaproteobacteria bacterium]|nr:NAD(P)-dependent oxidoreductase [Betaproteobacteria bacterium]
MSSIGFIGAGLMGMSMAERLHDCGHIIHICDIDLKREALGRSLGFKVHPTPASLAAS